MATYIGVPIETNPITLLERVYSYIQAHVPGWTPAEGNLDVWLAEALTAEASEIADTASRVPDSIFRYFGQSLMGLPPITATTATTTTTWTMIDNAGHTIPAGTQVGIRNDAGDLIAFYVVNEVVVPNGNTVTAAGAVTISALIAGADGSSLGSPGGPVELIDILDYVSSITMVAATINGVDAESDADYLNRLVEQFRLLTITPVLPSEFAALAKSVSGVYRAVAIDLYNPNHNLLTANQASVETDATGWAAITNVNIAQTAAQAQSGTKSLSMSSVAGGAMAADTTPITTVPAVPGETYTGRASVRSAVSARNCRVNLKFYTAASALIGAASNGAQVADTTVGWTEIFCTAVAPLTTAYVRVEVEVLATGGAAEVHYVDEAQLRHGTTKNWAAGGSPETNNEKYVTVVALDSNGAGVSSPIKGEIETLLESLRETNFVVGTTNPTVNEINVTVQVKVLPDFDAATVQAAVVAAIQTFLDPALWGTTGTDPRSYTSRTVIYKYELATAINAVDGVDYIVGALQLSIDPAAVAEQDVTMAGIVPLPHAHTITVTTA